MPGDLTKGLSGCAREGIRGNRMGAGQLHKKRKRYVHIYQLIVSRANLTRRRAALTESSQLHKASPRNGGIDAPGHIRRLSSKLSSASTSGE